MSPPGERPPGSMPPPGAAGSGGPPTVLDRRADRRGDPQLLADLADDRRTRVLDLASDLVPVLEGGQGGLAVRPLHPLADERRDRPGDAREPGAAGGARIAAGLDPERLCFLGFDGDGHGYVLVRHDDDAAARASLARHGGAHVTWRPLREVGSALSPLHRELALTGVALVRWSARSGYCPGCGARTRVAHAGWVRVCPHDGTEHYPRSDPAVIMAVVDRRGRLLLARGPSWHAGRLSVLAGFVEPGEPLVAAVVREVAEEVGLAVTDVRYVDSQPWPFPASLMVGFTALATAADPDAELRPDPAEITAAHWFTRPQLAAAVASGEVGLPSRLSLARRLIEGWYGGPLAPPVEYGAIRPE